MAAYGEPFARVYNELWKGFTTGWAPILHDFIGNPADKTLIDLCCGTGHLSRYFLERGYTVTAVDLSEAMLKVAAANNQEHVRSGKCTIIHADAKCFAPAGKFSAVISLYDSLNHLEDAEALRSCFASVRAALCDGGVFIFDLNTIKGLQRWMGLEIVEEPVTTMVKRGVYVAEQQKAYMEIIGFARNDAGGYDKFREMIFNTGFAASDVTKALFGAGFRSVEHRRGTKSFEITDFPEEEGRLFYVART